MFASEEHYIYRVSQLRDVAPPLRSFMLYLRKEALGGAACALICFRATLGLFHAYAVSSGFVCSDFFGLVAKTLR